MLSFMMPYDAYGPQPERPSAQPTPQGLSIKVRELEHGIQRLQLLNQALWELIRERTNLTDEEFEQKAREVDLRDGVSDGRMTETALTCPACGRVSSSKHWKCLYCGQEYQKPVMG